MCSAICATRLNIGHLTPVTKHDCWDGDVCGGERTYIVMISKMGIVSQTQNETLENGGSKEKQYAIKMMLSFGYWMILWVL